MADPFTLARFVEAQAPVLADVRRELAAGARAGSMTMCGTFMVQPPERWPRRYRWPASGDLDNAMKFAQRERRQFQNAPPYHRADPNPSDLNPQDDSRLRQKRSGRLF